MLPLSANSAGDLQVVAENARREVAQVDARAPVSGVTLAEANMSFAYWSPRLVAGLASALGLLALLLATMGLYSVMTYTVSRRTREMGILMALGAQSRDVLRLIVRRGMRLVVIGIALGLACALALTRLLVGLLPGVGVTDPGAFAGAAISLAAVGLLASYLPARRPAEVDRMITRRST